MYNINLKTNIFNQIAIFKNAIGQKSNVKEVYSFMELVYK